MDGWVHRQMNGGRASGRVVWLLLGRAGVVGREATGTLETRRDAPCQGRAGGGWLEFVFRHGTRSFGFTLVADGERRWTGWRVASVP